MNAYLRAIGGGLTVDFNAVKQGIKASADFLGGYYSGLFGSASRVRGAFKGSTGFLDSLTSLSDSTNPMIQINAEKSPFNRIGQNIGNRVGAFASISAYGSARAVKIGAKLGGKLLFSKAGRGLMGIAIGAVGLAMGSTVYNGIFNNKSKTSPTNLKTQLNAIYDQFVYENSNEAGMGNTMNFSGNYSSSPIPTMKAFQKKRGWDANALGATGDLVFALNATRRG